MKVMIPMMMMTMIMMSDGVCNVDNMAASVCAVRKTIMLKTTYVWS